MVDGLASRLNPPQGLLLPAVPSVESKLSLCVEDEERDSGAGAAAAVRFQKRGEPRGLPEPITPGSGPEGPGELLRGGAGTPPRWALEPRARVDGGEGAAETPSPRLLAGSTEALDGVLDGVHGRWRFCDEKDRAEPGLLSGEDGKDAPVGLTSSRCRCMRSRTTVSSLKGDGLTPSTSSSHIPNRSRTRSILSSSSIAASSRSKRMLDTSTAGVVAVVEGEGGALRVWSSGGEEADDMASGLRSEVEEDEAALELPPPPPRVEDWLRRRRDAASPSSSSSSSSSSSCSDPATDAARELGFCGL